MVRHTIEPGCANSDASLPCVILRHCPQCLILLRSTHLCYYMPIVSCVALAYPSLDTNQARHAGVVFSGSECGRTTGPRRLRGDESAIHLLCCKFAKQYELEAPARLKGSDSHLLSVRRAYFTLGKRAGEKTILFRGSNGEGASYLRK